MAISEVPSWHSNLHVSSNLLENVGKKRRVTKRRLSSSLSLVGSRVWCFSILWVKSCTISVSTFHPAQDAKYAQISGAVGKGDPPSASTSAKDSQRERLMDEQLKDPPRLPRGLEQHERRASRVDVNVSEALNFQNRIPMLLLGNIFRFAHRFLPFLALHPSKLYTIL